MTSIVVVYDLGAANPVEIRTGIGPLGEVSLALPPSPHNAELAPLIERLGLRTLAIPEDPAQAAERIRALRPDAVLTFSDRRVRLTAHVTHALDLPGHDPGAADVLTDKLLQRDALRRAGIDAVRYAGIRSAADWPAALAAVGLPAVLKPRRGEGSRDTHLIPDEAAARTLPTAEGFVLEEYLAGEDRGEFGDYVSVETVLAHGRTHHVAVTGKFPLLPPFRERGHIWPAPIADDERARLLTLVDRAVAALGVHTGILHTEIKLTPDGPRIIEVNGRLGGHINELCLHATGRSLTEAAARVALDRPPSASELPDERSLDAVFGIRTTPAPRLNATLVKATGAANVRRIPGVLAYRRLVQPGDRVTDSVQTQNLDLLVATAATNRDLLGLIARTQRELEFVFKPGEDAPSRAYRGDQLDGSVPR
ncbi:MAG TPA: ATP-grasp domain-containing protein [Actinospica sp.]|jgi:predicted ATP-grasp superfamily ATP-dependent carboligase|nr:ATP-grasp domain-containing protein [Actinospica sp.]